MATDDFLEGEEAMPSRAAGENDESIKHARHLHERQLDVLVGGTLDANRQVQRFV
jgi:hypothetical protein